MPSTVGRHSRAQSAQGAGRLAHRLSEGMARRAQVPWPLRPPSPEQCEPGQRRPGHGAEAETVAQEDPSCGEVAQPWPVAPP